MYGSVLGLLLLCAALVSSEMYTSIDEMEKMAESEQVVIVFLEEYIRHLDRRLEHLRKIHKYYFGKHKVAKEDIKQYLSNPINVFAMTKRLTFDLDKVRDVIRRESGRVTLRDFDDFITKKQYSFPTNEDLEGVALGVKRLQETYNLPTETVANGEIDLPGVPTGEVLTAGDCFELGKHLYFKNSFEYGHQWLLESLKRLNLEPLEKQTVDSEELYTYLAYISYKNKDIKEALYFVNEILKINPKNKDARKDQLLYQEMLDDEEMGIPIDIEDSYEDYQDEDADDEKEPDYDEEAEDEEGEEKSLEENDNKKELEEQKEFDGKIPRKKNITNNSRDAVQVAIIGNFTLEKKLYEKGCRGEYVLEDSITAQLKCRYVHNGRHFLMFQPYKEEQLYIDPKVVIYHDWVSDKEIETIKKLAQPRFRRAGLAGLEEYLDIRISKVGWLEDEEDPILQVISDRITDITNLTMKHSESLQVQNYGMGGQYEPHWDFGTEDDLIDDPDYVETIQNEGDRIATFLFYLSDVAIGGSTVFPALKVAAKPKKGTALFWYNLMKSGDYDFRVRHASCPVLSGSKWVANKWMHMFGQEFARPCDLINDKLVRRKLYAGMESEIL